MLKERPNDAKIHKILSIAPKLDTITYCSAIVMAFAMYIHQTGIYEQSTSVALLFFTTMLLVTNFTITFTIDWLKNEITPHLSPQEIAATPQKDSMIKILTTAIPTLRLSAAFVSMAFSIVIYYALTPAIPMPHSNPYFRYLISVMLFSIPTIYLLITLYASIKEKITSQAKQHANETVKNQKGTCQTAKPVTSDI